EHHLQGVVDQQTALQRQILLGTVGLHATADAGRRQNRPEARTAHGRSGGSTNKIKLSPSRTSPSSSRAFSSSSEVPSRTSCTSAKKPSVSACCTAFTGINGWIRRSCAIFASTTLAAHHGR